MDKLKLNLLYESINQSYKIIDKFLDPYEDDQTKKVVKAEKILRVKFHKDYRNLCLRYGFIENNGHVISGTDGLDQVENIVWLNKHTFKKVKLPKNMIFISYTNPFNGVLVLCNNSGQIYKTDYHGKGLTKIFNNINDLIKKMYG